MMRSAELQHCLESPLLWADSTAATLAAKDFENAEKYLKEAREKKDPIDQLNTAYLSMFCAAQALLHSAFYKAAGFRCVVTVLEESYVKQGKLEKLQVDHLVRVQKLEGPPAENVELAGSFLEAARKALRK
jgi:hypothetical protein